MKKLTFRHFQFIFLALSAALLVWGFRVLLFQQLPATFNDPLEDMSFAWYVPLFSAYVIWSERARLASAAGEPSFGGLLATLPFFAMGFLGVRGIQIRFEILSVIGLILTISWTLLGRRFAKALLFPAGFLLFCIPLATFLDVITVHLRLIASSCAYSLLHGFGVDVIRQGTMIMAADQSFQVDVATPCSGLRSIFALMALTAGYAYFKQPTWLRRAILFATAVPLAVLGNIVRILSICIVSKVCSRNFAMGFYHDYSGYVVFAVAILAMVFCDERLTRLCRKIRENREKFAKKEIAKNDVRENRENFAKEKFAIKNLAKIRRVVVASLFFAILFFAMLMQSLTPDVTLASAPAIALREIDGFTSVELEVSDAERTVLPADTQIMKRHYTSDYGASFHVTVVIGGASKSSIHRPELCLPGQGFQMKNPRTRTIAGIDWRVITLAQAAGAHTFGYTFFNQDGFHTASHVSRIFRDVLDRSLYNRIDRWVMVTIHANSSREDDFYSFAKKLKEHLK